MTGALAKALAAVQAEIRDPVKNKSGQVKGRKDYRYAGLDDLLAVARPALSKHGLAVSQPVDLREGRVGVRTLLLHEEGEQLESFYPVTWDGSAQERGSEVTYARRYSLEAMLGVAATEDDDGAAASDREEPAQREEPKAMVSPKAVDALVAAGWPRADVVEDVRDFWAWIGHTFDPWGVPEAKQLGMPAYVEKQQEQLDAWTAWREDVLGLLVARDLGFNDLVAYHAANDRPNPARMPREQREKVLPYLRDAGGLDQIIAHNKKARRNAA